jgi:hypothetical protein
MLTQIKQDLRQYYYDSTFRDLNLDSAYERSRAAIDEAPSFKHMLAIVAQFVDNLKDSHTRFIPPGLALNVRYGWTTKTIGDSCYIDWVRKDSDAEKKGLKRGERLVTWDRMEASRRSMRILSYVYYALSPREFVKLVVESPDGLLREVTVKAEIKRAQSGGNLPCQHPHDAVVRRHGDGVEIPEFSLRRSVFRRDVLARPQTPRADSRSPGQRRWLSRHRARHGFASLRSRGGSRHHGRAQRENQAGREARR